MRGSPNIKAIEEEMNAWEEKLISMQDIIDAWLLVSSQILVNYSIKHCSTWKFLFSVARPEDRKNF